MNPLRKGSNARKRHLYLIGFSGAGKSTIGPLLAKRLSCSFVDLDSAIERKLGMSISDCFRSKGERWFRRQESAMLASVATRTACTVIALGGGALLAARNRTLVRRSGVLVYLTCAMPELMNRMKRMTDRPLLLVRPETLRETIRTLLSSRRPTYETADIRVTTTRKSPANAVQEIIRALRKHYGSNSD